MSCDITKGRTLACKDSTGGLYDVYFFNYTDPVSGTETTAVVETSNDLITDINNGSGGSATAYKWKVKGASNLEETINSARDAGTTFYSQALNLTFTKLDPTTRKEIKLMAWGRPKIVVVDNNGNALFCGLENGCEVTGGTVVTGTAMGDLSGYTLVLTGEERYPANFLQGATKTDPFGGMATTVNVIEGSDSATYVLGAGSACASGVVSGTYTNGVALNVTNYIEVDVTVSITGAWNVDTDTVNGYRFSGSGNFAATGTQTIRLYGIGTPDAAQSDSFTLSPNDLGGSGTCTQSVTVA